MYTLRIGFTLIFCALCLPASAAPPAQLKLIPADGFAFVSIRVADLSKTEVVRPLVTTLREAQSSPITQAETRTGLKLEDIERVTVVIPTGEPEPVPVVLVTTAKPYDASKILTGMNAMSPNQRRGMLMDRYGSGSATNDAPVPYKTEPIPPKEDFKEEGDKCGEEVALAQPERPGQQYEPDLNAPYYFVGDNAILYLLDDRNLALLFGADRVGVSILAYLGQLMRPQATGGLTEALKALEGDHLVVAGLNVPAVNRLVPADLPFSLLPLRTLLRAEGATLTADIDQNVTMNIALRFQDEESAKRAEQVMSVFRTMLVDSVPALRKDLNRRPEENAPVLKLLDQMEKAMRDATIATEGPRVTAKLSVSGDEALAATVRAATLAIDRAGRRTRAFNNFKQIGLAMHNYHDIYGAMPAHAIFSRDGKPLLSWRVAILPFIEQDNLYRQFRLDEPWDSEHNIKLLPQMPEVYAIPNVRTEKKGETFVQGFLSQELEKDSKFVSGEAFFPLTRGVARLGANGRRFAGIPDGTSNTIMVVESATSVPWTKPADMPFDPDNLPKLGGHLGDGFVALLCDGSVRFISSSVSDETLRRLICPNDGFVIDREELGE